MTHEQVERINELARKRKTIGLTDEETREQTALRKQYLDEFKASMQSVLDTTYIERPDGSREKLQKKNEK